jgi:3-deoxy-7-phosphoheptulonate synthase
VLELDQAVAATRRAVRIGPLAIGEGRPCVIAGPCSVENDFVEHAQQLAEAGVDALRAGIFKPRTRPESFRGLGLEALPLVLEARERTGLPLVSEVLTPDDADLLAGKVDAFQVGTRNMYNYRLLEHLGDLGQPVILKRGFSATFDEWVGASEYIRRRGNDQVVLCERGIRTFEPRTRNTLDVSSVVVLSELTDLPVIIDPSHAAGNREWVPALAAAAIAVGASGLLLEAHPTPERAWSDSRQTVDLTACAGIVADAARSVLRRSPEEIKAETSVAAYLAAIDAEVGRLQALRQRLAPAWS